MMSSSSKILPATRLDGVDKNVWLEFTALAAEHKACNLGQGFPDFSPPSFITKELANIPTQSQHLINQYTRAFGHGPLVENLSKLFSPLYGVEIDPLKEILISIGGYGALFSCFQAFIQAGDEVIIIEPYFDCYEPMVKYSGGTCRFIPLRPREDRTPTTSADWTLDKDELRKLFSKNTKAIVINTPNNPLGKVFKREELQMIADLCVEFDCLCISDEVYEWLTFDDSSHVRIASLPGMWDRTLTVGSAGKTFSITGWKLGWTIGPSHLMKHVQTVHQNSIYACATPLQEAISRAFAHEISVFGKEESYFKTLPRVLASKRDRMFDILKETGLRPIMPQGGYFMIADASALDITMDDSVGSDDLPWDHRFVKWLIINKKVATIPTSAFYCQDHKSVAGKYIRFCFCKEDETIERMAEIFRESNFSK